MVQHIYQVEESISKLIYGVLLSIYLSLARIWS